jgi:FtsH-binding integral membrane protein
MASDELGSLSQKVRTDSLRSARIIMIIVGLLMSGANLFFALSAEAMVDKEINDLRKSGMVFDEAKLKPFRDSAIRTTQLAAFVFVGVGAIFFVLAAMIYKAPVPCTVTALVLYVGGWVASVAIAISNTDDAKEVGQAVASGWLVRILIIIALVKAVQAAIAYQKERQNEAADRDADGDGLAPLGNL